MDVDVVCVALHGTYGEDGTAQRIIESYGVQYTGSGPFASTIAMNKHLTKEHVKKLGIKTPKHMRLSRNGIFDVVQIAESISEMFGPSYAVKPQNGGSSIDMIMVNNPTELAAAIKTVLNDYEESIVEERNFGRDATVGILENLRNERY